MHDGNSAESFLGPGKAPVILMVDEVQLFAGGHSPDGNNPARDAVAELMRMARRPNSLSCPGALVGLTALRAVTGTEREFTLAARQAGYGWDSIATALGRVEVTAAYRAASPGPGQPPAWTCPGCEKTITDYPPHNGYAAESGHAGECPRLALAEFTTER